MIPSYDNKNDTSGKKIIFLELNEMKNTNITFKDVSKTWTRMVKSQFFCIYKNINLL